jgi:hypothetical protein
MGDQSAIDEVWSRLRPAGRPSGVDATSAAVRDAVRAGLLQAAVPLALAALRADPLAEVGADELAAALRTRGWDGDEIAAETLLAARSGTPTGRTEIVADLEMLGDVIGQQLGGYLELATGESWPTSIFDDGGLEDVDDDEFESDRWMDVPGDSREAWKDMADFAAAVEDDHVREVLQVAIEGRGAFSRFKSALDRHDTYWGDWHVWSSERQLGRARDWLATEGFDPQP